MPYWIMQNLLLSEGDHVTVQNVTLPLANFVKFRPRSVDFINLSNPKTVLENTLRNFSCLTVDDQICINYNGKNYFIDVTEVKPSPAACIIEADVNVDFEPPVGYVDPAEQAKAAVAAAASAAAESGAGTGGGSIAGSPALGSAAAPDGSWGFPGGKGLRAGHVDVCALRGRIGFQFQCGGCRSRRRRGRRGIGAGRLVGGSRTCTRGPAAAAGAGGCTVCALSGAGQRVDGKGAGVVADSASSSSTAAASSSASSSSSAAASDLPIRKLGSKWKTKQKDVFEGLGKSLKD